MMSGDVPILDRIHKIKATYIVGSLLCGLVLTLVTGLFENRPPASIIGATHYGYPLVWRVTMMVLPQATTIILGHFLGNLVFWGGLCFAGTYIIPSIKTGECKGSWKPVAKGVLLVITCGFVMALVHEVGHALWGTMVGGSITFIQVFFLELYPRLALTREFTVGFVRVEGLTGAPFGTFLIGGSITSNIASWVLGLLVYRHKRRRPWAAVLRVLGVYGLLDLPLYVVLPQLGLRHWIVIGGDQPEPLIGARLMGIPDPIFYLSIILTSLGLSYIYVPQVQKYFKNVRQLITSPLK
jgi:hypothetical protein